MDVILHVGAHRCATTTFQSYMRRNAAVLTARRIGFWGPLRTRGGLFDGAVARPGLPRGAAPQAARRVRRHLVRSAAAGLAALVVSDENMLGFLRDNRDRAALYRAAGDRVAQFAALFDGRLARVALNVRSQDAYWASALGYVAARGHGLPPDTLAGRLAAGAEGWRNVVADIAAAVPGADIVVLPFERFAGRPELQLAALTGQTGPMTHARDWLNATPRLDRLRAGLGRGAAARLPAGNGRWSPFTPEQAAALRAAYAGDLAWLAAGADGLARLAGNSEPQYAGQSPHMPLTRGRRNDQQHRRLAGAG